MQRTNGKPAARVTEPARRQSDPVMGPEPQGARYETAGTQRFSALQQRLLCSALHFFHRHIRSDPDVIQRMDGNHVFRQFYEVQYQTDKPNLDPIFSASVHDASALHICSFILSILHQGIFSVSAFIVSVIYLSRFKEASHITLHACTWRPLFITALLVADKMWEDKPVRNSSLAKLFPVLNNAELNRMENRFLMGIKFNVLVKPDLFCSFCEKLLAENVHPDVLQCVSQSEYANTLGPDPAAPPAPVPKEEKLNGVSHQSGNRAVAVTRTSVPAVMPQRAESAARSGSAVGTDPRFATADQRVPMGGSLAVRAMARPEAANARVASSQRVAASHPAARAQSAGPGPYSATRSRVGGKPGSSRAESVQARDGRAASPAVGTPTADTAGAGTPTQDHSSPHPTQGLGPPAVHPRAARSSSPLLYVPPPRSGAPGTQLAPGSGMRGTSPGGLAARPAGTMQQAQRPASTGPSMRVGQPGPVPLSPSLPNGQLGGLAGPGARAQPVLAHHPPSPHFRTASPGVAMSRGGPTGMQGATAAATRSGSVPTAAGLAQQRGRSPAPGPPGVQPMLMPGTGHLRVLTPHRSSFGGPVMPHRLG